MKQNTRPEKIETLWAGSGSADKVTIRTFGSTEDVNKALTAYEYKDSIIIVDCGIGYPDIFEMPGVDVLIPDFTYLIENSHKLKAVLLTHGHEDHIGAVPYLLQEIPDAHIYSSQLVQEILKTKLTERNFKELAQGTHFHLFDPSSGEITLGDFKVSAIHVNHSIPEAQGFAIKTKEDTLLHIAEYKFDETPVLDKPIDVATIKKYGDAGVLCLISDCLLVTTSGSTKSEKTLSNTFFELFEKSGNRQVFVTTISSNISRMYQIADAAVKYGRKIVPSGRSIEEIVRISRSLGYLPFPDDSFVTEKEAKSYDQGALVYIIAGCYGQPESSLGKLSRKVHEIIELEPDALVVFSGDPAPPGTEITVGKMTDNLVMSGAEIVNSDIQENLHVSGHGTRDDIAHMIQLVHPKYFVPIGGTITKMRAFKNLVEDLGIDKNSVFECLEGESVDFSGGKAHKGRKLDLSPVFINTNKADEIDPRVVKDRELLKTDGVFVVVVAQNEKGSILTNKVEVITRGFIFVKDSQELMDRSKKFITKTLNKQLAKTKDFGQIRKNVERELDHFLYKETGKAPLIIVHSITV